MKKIIFIQTNYPNFLKEFHEKHSGNEIKYKDLKNYWSSEMFGSSDFYLKNLKKHGWSGDEIIVNDWTIQSAWAKEHNLKLINNFVFFEKYLPQRITNMLGLNDKYKKILFEQIKYHKPDIAYIHDITYFSKRDLKKIRKFTKLIVGQIAYPKPLNENIFKSYDLIISSLPNFIEDFKKMGIKTEYLRWCFEETIIKQVKGNHSKYDVTYIGGFSPHHSNGNRVLESVARKIKIDFWGYGINFLNPLSPIRKTYHGEAWGRNMYKIFADSKIVINRHINISGKYANNMRLFEATGMGALLITDNKSNIDEFFVPGKEIIVYNSPQDLIDKVNYYLKHPKERLKIAQAGQKKTLEKHTYKIRMRELDKILKKYL